MPGGLPEGDPGAGDGGRRVPGQARRGAGGAGGERRGEGGGGAGGRGGHPEDHGEAPGVQVQGQPHQQRRDLLQAHQPGAGGGGAGAGGGRPRRGDAGPPHGLVPTASWA